MAVELTHLGVVLEVLEDCDPLRLGGGAVDVGLVQALGVVLQRVHVVTEWVRRDTAVGQLDRRHKPGSRYMITIFPTRIRLRTVRYLPTDLIQHLMQFF